jgi:hypothetical protein
MDFKVLRLLFFIGAFLGSISIASSQQSSFSELVVIGNSIGSSTLSEQQVRDIFRARSTFWKNGNPVIICLPQTRSKEAELVCRVLYGRTVNEVQKFWLSEVFQGRSRSPVFFENPKDLIDYIAKTKGAIGSVPVSFIKLVPSELVVVINASP